MKTDKQIERDLTNELIAALNKVWGDPKRPQREFEIVLEEWEDGSGYINRFEITEFEFVRSIVRILKDSGNEIKINPRNETGLKLG